MVHCYIWNSNICKYAKAFKDQYNGLLKLLLIFSYLWTKIPLDFVTGLASSNGYNIVIIVVDWLTKKILYSYTIDNNDTIAETTTYLLFNNV